MPRRRRPRASGVAPFVGGEIPDAELAAIVKDAYATFRHPSVTPLVEIGPGEAYADSRCRS